jgi:galactokinase
VSAPDAGAWLESVGVADLDVKRRLLERAAHALGPQAPGAVRWIYVPGRIEVFGKHTDYAGGRTLVCAASRGFCGAFAPSPDRRVRIHDVCGNDRADFALDSSFADDLTGWKRYAATVVRRVAHNFPGTVAGVDVAFASDLPQAAGLSSSSALMVTVLTALIEASALPDQPSWRAAIRSTLDLAAFAACVENGSSYGPFEGDSGVGTAGGSEDHTAMLCGQRDALTLCRFVPPRIERAVALSRDVVFLVGVSGIHAEKTGVAREAYNDASRRARVLLDLWRRDSGREATSLAEALESTPAASERLMERAVAADVADATGRERLTARLRQFTLESTMLVPAAAEAFARSDWAGVGGLAERSHRAADEWLGNQVPETNALVATARKAGALAASAFGAGFGGSAWALAPRDEATAIRDRWRVSYAAACQHAAPCSAFFESDAGPPATWTRP